MSDTTLNRFLGSGTAAEMAAHVPVPPTPASGPDQGYVFFNTDDGLLYSWDGANWVTATAGAPAGAKYVTVQAEAGLSAEVSLGALTDGILKHTVAAGVSTPATAAAGTDYVAPGAITTSGLTQATARLLGRTTASSGAVEEITVGSGLSLSAGSLTASGGTGDVVGPAASIDSEIALYDSTTGKLLKRATATGLLKGTSGVLSAATAGTDYCAATSGSSVLKGSSGNTTAAVDGTDYVSPTTQRIVQVVNTQTGAVATGTTTVPLDDTIPQKTEGDEYMTLAITPTSSTNKLRIEVVFFGCHTAASAWMIVALFQDTTTDALAAGTSFQATGGGSNNVSFSHYMTAGTTSATTFKVRAGGQTGGTTTFNGQGGGRLFGGVEASSITITEVKV